MQGMCRLMIMMLTIVVGAPVARAADPSLLLHYTFDQVEGDVAADLGPHGHDGKIIGETERLDELDGRQGVLRFDGDTSRINGPADKALQTGGDLTFEMWVRGNNADHKGGTYLNWGSNFILFGFGEPMAQYRNGSDTVRTKLAEHSMLSEHWAHVAVVVEYPRIRLYRNGELIGDKYMPFPAIVPDGAGRIIGAKCPIDLDEVRVYSRALTTREIKAHAQGRDIDIPRENELRAYANWYDGTVMLHLAVKGADVSGESAELTILRGDQSNAVEPRRATFTESYEGSGRYIATAVFPLADLENQSLDMVARLSGGETVFRHVDMDKPAWINTPEGRLTEVPAPWTPLQAQASDGSVRINVWGRSHIFGDNLFPQQIEAIDKQILAAPVTLHARADGEAIQWQNASVKLAAASDIAATLEQSAASDSVSIDMNTVMEFDGYAIFDCTITANRDTTLDQLVLEIPLRTEHATLCFGSNVYEEQMEPRVPMSVLHMGAVDGDLSFRFSPSVWLGDEELGLTWQAESNEDWRYGDPQKAIEILPRGETTHFRANWIIVPTQLAAGETLHYKFALQATPVKPMLRDAWDLRIIRSDPYTGSTGNLDLNLPDRYVDVDHEIADRIFSINIDDLNRMEPGPGRVPALKWYREMGARHLWINTHDNWPWPMPADPEYARDLRRLIDAVHAEGLNIYGYQIHERMPTNVPEYDIYGANMTNRPFRPYEWCIGFCPNSAPVRDAILYNTAGRLDEFGDDGLYLDGTGVHMKSCQNTAHGCGYEPRDGAISVGGSVVFDQAARGSDASLPVYPTYPVFADRKFIQRLYVAVKKRRPNGVLDVHSWYLNSGGLAYADMLWTGEQWWHLRGKGTDYVAGELTLDTFRTMFMGYQIGVAAETLPYRLIGNNAHNSTVAAISLLHDVPVRVRVQDTEWFHIMSKLWQVRDAFGAKQAEKLFYWNNQDYVAVSPDECYATLLKHPTNGTLAIVSNLRRDAADVDVRFNLDALGFESAAVTATDVLTGESTPLGSQGAYTTHLGSHEWVYLWLTTGE